jgi:hypothetical protein
MARVAVSTRVGQSISRASGRGRGSASFAPADFVTRGDNLGQITVAVTAGSNPTQGHAMAQTVSCRPLTVEAQVYACISPRGICGGQSGTGTDFSEFFSFPLPISFHHGSPRSCITWGMNNRHIGGCSSETQSHPHRQE